MVQYTSGMGLYSTPKVSGGTCTHKVSGGTVHIRYVVVQYT